jgi:hypothetical protein
MKLTIKCRHLQPGAVNDLVVNSHLHAIIVDDKDTDAASAIVERLCEARHKRALVEDGKALLDVARLGHGNDATILTDVEDTVLLEDRAEHVLDNDGRSRVGDEGGLLVELLGEQVDTEVAVLASLRGGGDTDHLAGAALENQEIADADVVARDGDGVGRSHCAGGGWGSGWDGVRGTVTGGGAVDTDDAFNRGSGGDGTSRCLGGVGGGVLFLNNYVLLAVVVLGSDVGVGVGVVRVTLVVDGVGDAFSYLVGCLVETVAERVILAVVVVISHITLVLLGGRSRGASSDFYSVLLGVGVGVLGGDSLSGVARGLLVVGRGGEVGVTLLGDDGTSALAELTLGDVDLGGSVVGGWAVDCVEVTVVGAVVDLYVGVDGR